MNLFYLLEPLQFNMAPAKRRPVSSPEKQRIVDLHNDGMSTYDIVDLVGRSNSIVQHIVAKFKTSGSIESSPRTSRHLEIPCHG